MTTRQPERKRRVHCPFCGKFMRRAGIGWSCEQHQYSLVVKPIAARFLKEAK